ncbi:MAG: thrombospondin type 3 repeat-containing protein [Myxococcales bacterium]|nr:thrombospondin type 3 repeat-containing protein [Myxococcales bacterium]
MRDCGPVVGFAVSPSWQDPAGGFFGQSPAIPDQYAISTLMSLTGAEHARKVARFMTCAMQQCVHHNTWDGDIARVDPDTDQIHSRCDVCPTITDRDQRDRDHDGHGDACDNCPDDPGPQHDRDGDGHGDVCDVCPDTPDPEQRDLDADGVGDACDNCRGEPNRDQRDRDQDALGDACDNCPRHANDDQTDTDRDGAGDACDVCPDLPDPEQRDGDADGIGDACDLCPDTPDPEQHDTDGDGVGDACDRCPDHPDPWQEDGDDDGIGDACDLCPKTPDPEQSDRDGDGIGDACDRCVAAADPEQRDSDADGIGDACCGEGDPDDDGWSNCAWYPPGHLEAHGAEPQTGAPDAIHEAWRDRVIPGDVSCIEGRRVCVPAGTPPGFSAEEVEAFALQQAAAGGPDVLRYAEGSADDAIARCMVIADALGRPIEPAEWRACLEAVMGPPAPDPPPGPDVPTPAAPIEVEFDVPGGRLGDLDGAGGGADRVVDAGLRVSGGVPLRPALPSPDARRPASPWSVRHLLPEHPPRAAERADHRRAAASIWRSSGGAPTCAASHTIASGALWTRSSGTTSTGWRRPKSRIHRFA